MKILALHLRAFGPFTDERLDLSAGEQGLHLIYGPNEAGKSSALRAIEQLFFGIPANSSDNFIHPYPKLRIGAALRTRDGKQIEVVRRKGNKNTLRGPDDQTPFDEAELGRLLGGLDRDAFTTMFGIDHERLREGGENIAQGGGSVGQSLFSAGAGISNLRAVREGLEGDAAKLFVPRGGSQRAINHSLAKLKEAKRAIRDAGLPSARWVEHEQRLREADRRLAEVEARLAETSREKTRCERIRDALRWVSRRKELLRELDGLADAAILPDDFAKRRIGADEALRFAQTQEKAAREALERLDAEAESLVVPDTLLEQSEAIGQLQENLGSYRKAQRDRPGLVAQREQLRKDGQNILREIAPDLSLEMADRLRLTSRQKVEIQNLGNRRGVLASQLDQARTAIGQSRAELDEVERELAELPPPRDPATLKDAIRRTQAQGDLEAQRAEALAELTRRERQAAVDLAKLPDWSGSLDDLERLAVPVPETIDRFDERLVESDRRRSELERESKSVESKRAQCDRRIEALRLEGDVPSEDDLNEARRLRDRGWQLIVAQWKEGRADPEQVEAYLAHCDGADDLADAYGRTVQRADDLADRLRREANRVAQLAQLRAERQSLEQQLAELVRQRTEADDERREVDRQWNACLEPLGLTSRSPREMRAWLDKQRALAAQAETIRAARRSVGQCEQRIDAYRRELARGLESLGEPAPADAEPLGALLGRCQILVEAIDERATRHRQATAERARLIKALRAAEAASRRAEEQIAEWRDHWARALEPLNLDPDTPPEAANEVLARIDDLFDRLNLADALTQRIDGIDREAELFRDDVRQMAERIDPELRSAPVEQQVQEFTIRLKQALADDQARRSHQKQREQKLQERGGAQKTIDRQRALLEAMCRDAGCARPDELPEAIERSDRKKRLRDDLERVDDQLGHLAQGAAIDDFVAEVEAVDADALPNRLDRLAEEIEQLKSEQGDLRETRGREQTELANMDAGAAAADAAEEVEGLLARLESDVRQYARLRLAAAVLEEAMERYRQKNEGPLLGRAGALFGRLTLSAFDALRTDMGRQDENVLVGVRPGQTAPVHLEGMSEGTRDQLYLALRLASLENHLKVREPVPFIVDDVLISFDDHRAAAALEVLADLSARTQVVFFTHHEHLVNLAERHVDGARLFVHRLPRDNP